MWYNHRKFKKVQAKKLVKSSKSIFFSWNCIFGSFSQFKNWFLAIFEIAKKWNLGKKNFSWNWFIWFHEFFWPGLFFNFMAHCELSVKPFFGWFRVPGKSDFGYPVHHNNYSSANKLKAFIKIMFIKQNLYNIIKIYTTRMFLTSLYAQRRSFLLLNL